MKRASSIAAWRLGMLVLFLVAALSPRAARAQASAQTESREPPSAQAPPVDDRALVRPRYAPSARIGAELDGMLGPTRGLAARMWTAVRFTSPIALRVRMRPTGFAIATGSTQPMAAVDAVFGLDTGPVGLYVGAGVGWVRRRTHALSRGEGSAFGVGHYFVGGARFGDADSFGADFEASLAPVAGDERETKLGVQLDFALRFAVGPRGLLTFHGELGTLTPSSIRIASELRLRLRGDGGPGSIFVLGALGWQQLTRNDLDSSAHPMGAVVSIGSEARLGSRSVSRPLLAERRQRAAFTAALAPVDEAGRREAAIVAFESRGNRLRRAGRIMLGIAAVSTVVGFAVLVPSDDLDRIMAGGIVLVAVAAPMWIAGSVTFPVGRRQVVHAHQARARGRWPTRARGSR